MWLHNFSRRIDKPLDIVRGRKYVRPSLHILYSEVDKHILLCCEVLRITLEHSSWWLVWLVRWPLWWITRLPLPLAVLRCKSNCDYLDPLQHEKRHRPNVWMSSLVATRLMNELPPHWAAATRVTSESLGTRSIFASKLQEKSQPD